MRIAVVGAGAMGQLFGGRLALAGNEVVFFDANAELIAALNERGITLHGETGAEHTPVRVMRADEFRGELDLVIIFTKGFHTAAAVESVRALIGPDTVGLTLQNGLGNPELLQQVFGADRTLMGMTDFPADLREPGVLHTSDAGKVRLGGIAPGSPHAERIAAVLDAAGLHAAAQDDIVVSVWEKVIFNAGFNTLSAATGFTVGEIAADSRMREVMNAVLAEGIAVAGQAGVAVSEERIAASVANAYEHHTHHKTSMLLDREAGRRTEIDSIGGAIVRLGAEHGVPTPVLWTLAQIVRAFTER